LNKKIWRKQEQLLTALFSKELVKEQPISDLKPICFHRRTSGGRFTYRSVNLPSVGGMKLHLVWGLIKRDKSHHLQTGGSIRVRHSMFKKETINKGISGLRHCCHKTKIGNKMRRIPPVTFRWLSEGGSRGWPTSHRLAGAGL